MRPFILFTESSANIGGQELQALAQMSGLRARGVDTLLVCKLESRIGEEAQRRGLPVVHQSLRSAGDLRSLFALRRRIASLAPAAVICHSGHDAYLAGVAAKALQRFSPRVIRMRTYKSSVNAFFYNSVFDVTLTPSEAMRTELLRRAPVRPEKVRVLYPGIDFSRLEARAREELGHEGLRLWLASHRGPVITIAAMLRGEKGHTTLLQSLARLVGSHPYLGCVIAGEGSQRTRIEALIAELGLGNHTFMAGFVDNVPALIRRSDLVVVPSVVEPLGMTQIESLALETPVVASNVDGIPETVQHEQTGLLVAPGDVAAWSAALASALARPERMRALAIRGREAVRERFSLRRNIEELMAQCGLPDRNGHR